MRFLFLDPQPFTGAHVLAQARRRAFSAVLAAPAKKLASIPHLVAQAEDVLAVEYEGTDPAALLDAVRKAHRRRPLDAIVCHREYGLVPAAHVAEELGLPSNPVEVVLRTRDKHATRETLRRAGFTQPRVFRIETPADARAIASSPGRWIVKPPSAVASAGVTLLESPADLEAAWERALAVSADGSVLIEEYVEGEELSVEGIAGDEPRIVALTAKWTTQAPHFIELRHVVPAPLSPAARSRVADAVAAAVHALGVRIGLFHVEVFVTPTDVVIGEVHARAGGDCIPILVDLAYGMEFYGLSFDQLRGAPIEAPAESTRRAGIVFFAAPQGRLRSVTGLDELRAQPDVVHVHLDVEPGDDIPALGWSFDRVGWFIAVGGSHSQLVGRLDELERLVTFDCSGSA
jgi:biotin carboxylase